MTQTHLHTLHQALDILRQAYTIAQLRNADRVLPGTLHRLNRAMDHIRYQIRGLR